MTRQKDLESVLAITVGMAILFLVFRVKIFLTISVIVGLSGLLSKYLAKKISWLWLKLTEGLGAVMSKIILTVVFAVFLLPLSLLAKIFRKKDDLRLIKSAEQSYYIIRDHEYIAKDLENVW